MQGMPAGLPCGMPGMGDAIDGAVQQAPQCGRHGIGGGACATAMTEIGLEMLGNVRVVKVE